jgi:Xaa-Pro dipeptidase
MMIEQWSPEWSNAVFSTQERDLRWKNVRELMARDGLDALVVMPCSNNHNRGGADSLYLTQLGENADETVVFFPIEGEPTAWLSRGGVWPSSNWFTDIRNAPRGSGGKVIVERLKEAGLEGGRIGIPGLTGGALAHCREAEGEVNWQSMDILQRGLPNAKVSSATDLLGEARFVKTEEEIEFVRKGTQIAEKVLQTVVETAGTGVSERHVFSSMMYTSAIEGGSFTPMFGWISGNLDEMNHRVEQPSFRSFEKGDVLVLEIDGRWGSYISQIDQTFTMGPAHQDTKDAMEITYECFDRTMENLKPGVLIKDLMELAMVEGMGGRGVATLGMHGRGPGDDGPLVTPRTNPLAQQVVLQENAVMCVKPGASVDGKGYAASWGDSVIVTKNGGVRLGTRERTLHELS